MARIPKPQSIAVGLNGDKYQRKQPDLAAPPGWPACPPHFVGEAKKEWHSICQQLEAIKVLSTVDSKLIELYVDDYTLYREADQKLREEGAVLKGPNGGIIYSPYSSMRSKLRDAIRKHLQQMGLTPAARASMRLLQNDEIPADDPMTKFIPRKIA